LENEVICGELKTMLDELPREEKVLTPETEPLLPIFWGRKSRRI
jgi:hypothetical protein